MSRELDWVYKDQQRIKAFKIGFAQALKCAAEFIESHHAAANGYRLADLLLMKFGQTKRKPRRAKETK